MKKIIYSTLIILLSFGFCIGQTIQGTINVEGKTATVSLMPSGDVSNTNDFAFLLTVSIPTNTGQASEMIGNVTSPIPGAAIAPQPVQTIEGRWVYPFSITGSGAITWPAGSENIALVVQFPTENSLGEKVQLNDYTASDVNDFTAYFYTELQAIDFTNYAAKFYGNEGESIVNSEFGDSFIESNSVLPIKLNRFTATKGERSVNLDWSTSSEINGSHFDVQRSRDLSTWMTIGTVDAVGESTSLQEYQLVDKDLPLSTRSSKTFYYRLNMVDNDGSSELSEIRTVRFDQDGADFIVYPNPSINEVFVNLSSITAETGPATMHVINMKGERVKEVTLSTNDDVSVDISNITSGVYYFVVNQGAETFTQKVIKID